MMNHWLLPPMMNLAALEINLTKLINSANYRYSPDIIAILTDQTEEGKDGYPIISERSFANFQRRVPHLFKNGSALINYLDLFSSGLSLTRSIGEPEKKSISRALQVLRNLAYTAGVTAPSDLWIARHLLSTYSELNVLKDIAEGKVTELNTYAAERKFNADQLNHDFCFLVSRGYLEMTGTAYEIGYSSQAQEIPEKAKPLPKELRADMVSTIIEELTAKRNLSKRQNLLNAFFAFDGSNQQSPHHGWIASWANIELGFRVLPLVLALRVLDLTKDLKVGVQIDEIVPRLTAEMLSILEQAGTIDANRNVAALGERVFQRGPGPFGIIHAYHSYMTNHRSLIEGKTDKKVWVARGANVAASQDANAKTFELANSSLDQYCKDSGFKYDVYIEHAVGRGEGTRQRFLKSGEKAIQYFGADLEDAAINKAVEAQKAGRLPKNMIFIRQADIGEPGRLIAGVKDAGFALERSVMLVGNGFHEVRNQTNERMIEVFKGYRDAGILLIFTEESGLSNDDLLATGWNTYHAGFRYVHAISGQGLRPAYDRTDDPKARYSWEKCATMAGYTVKKEYTTRTRTIYPHPRPDGYNPAISVNYFCIP